MRLVTAICTLIIFAPRPAYAQTRQPEVWTVEIQTRDRWLHGREHEPSTPFLPRRDWIVIDSIRQSAAGGTRALHLTVDGTRADSRGLLMVDPIGRVMRIEATPEERSRSGIFTEDEYVRIRRSVVANGGAGVRLPESIVWNLIPAVRPVRLEVGARWVDTVELTAEHDGVLQSLSEERSRRVVGDTVVAGQRLWLVRDSADVRYRERWVEQERTLDTLVTSERTARGTTRGWSLYDRDLDVARARADTTVLSGEAVLTYPDGRRFATPARYERARRSDLHDPAALEARRSGLAAERSARRTGMLVMPTDEIERRLTRGDEELEDSLLAAWQLGTDPNERARIFGMLARWGSDSSDLEARLERMSLEAGDTARRVRILSRLPPRRQLDAEALDLLLPFLEDPGRAFAFDVRRDPLYENIRDGLLRTPPAITGDTAAWSCTPSVCRRLAEQWETATEPRLRDLGLIAHLVLDPTSWTDEVITRAEAGSAFLEPAVQLVRGVGATWKAASKAPLPGPAQDWRAWLEWMNGTNQEYRARFNRPEQTHVRFDRSHATALRFSAILSGRDVVAELRRKLAEAPSDSARLIYDTVLLGLGERDPDPHEVAERLLVGSPADRHRGRREMHRLFRAGETADSTLQVELLDRLLSIVIEGAEPWPPVEQPRAEDARGLRRLAGDTDQVFLQEDSLPPGVRKRWRDRVQLTSTTEARLRLDPVPGMHFQVSRVVRVGPFVRLGVDYTGYIARGEGLPPHGYAGGITVYLLRTDEGWALVSASEWIT